MPRAAAKYRPPHARKAASVRPYRPPGQPRERRQQTAGRSWYSTERWRKRRRAFLRQHPFCVECRKENKPLSQCLADTVDHKIPHRGDYELFWAESNWQSLCGSHHSRKTCMADGGFGHKQGVAGAHP